MVGTLKRIGCLLLVGALLAALLPQTEPVLSVNAMAASRFYDIDGHPSAAAIERWAELGVAWGSNGYFFPDSHMTRAEFLAMLNRLFGTYTTTSISQFLDVSHSSWYYDDISRAYAAGYVQGTSESTMSPNDRITREEMITILANAVGLYAPNASALSDQYSDASEISGFARGYVAAFTSYGWLTGDGGLFNPRDVFTRAEICVFLSKMFPNVFSGTDSMSGSSLTGNLLVRSPGVVLSNMTLAGDLVLGDGVGLGNISLRNCIINGRLVIRGGGPNSVSLSSTTVTGGVYIYNPNGTTRLVNVNEAVRMGIVTARTSTIFEGSGLSSVVIPDNAVPGSEFTFRDVNLDSVITGMPQAYMTLESGVVDNFRFLSTAGNSSLRLDLKGTANYLDINAPNVTITGRGEVDVAVINASGVSMAMTPRFLSIGPGMTAIVAGNEVSGGDVGSGTSYVNTVDRSSAPMAVTRDAANVGGAGLTLTTTYINTANQVQIKQDAASAVAVSDLQRLAYWVGFFVPVPEKYQDPVIRMTYTFEAGTDAVYSLPVLTQNSIKGVVVYIPVKVDNTGKTGVIDTTVYFVWGDATYENIQFKSDPLKLAAPSASQLTTMAGYFANSFYRAYNKTNVFTGSEALRRLLEGDNALGLDLRGYQRYDESDKAAFNAQMFEERSKLTTQKSIQDYINNMTQFIGALYAVNRAQSVVEMQEIIEAQDMADQLGIDIGENSLYRTLSTANRRAVANDLLLARKVPYADEAAVAAAFDKAVSDRRTKEAALLSSINNTSAEATMQKLLEAKANADQIGIVVDGDPYKSAAASTKLAVAKNVVMGRLYKTLDQVKAKFEELIGTPEEPVKFPPELDPNILSVTAGNATRSITVGEMDTIIPTITTTSGSFSDPTVLKWSMDKPNIATVNELTGQIMGVSLGTATLTISSKVDTKKSVKIKINVIATVPVVGIALNYAELDISVGQTAQLLPTKTPTNGTDKLRWSSDDPKIATVSEGFVTGVGVGFTTITCRTDSGIRTTCKIFVGDDLSSVIMQEKSVRVGIECIVKLNARVSPVSTSNRQIVWTSDAPGVAKVDSNGVVTGVASGTTTIRARSVVFEDKYAECEVIVDPKMSGVFMDESQITMYKGGVKTLSAVIKPDGNGNPLTDLSWTVSGPANVLQLTKDKDTGAMVAQAVGAGTVTVMASISDNAAAFDTCEVVVLPDALSVTIKPTSLNMKAGETALIDVTFGAKTQPANPLIDYRSEDENVATVHPHNGTVTAVAGGKTRIIVKPQADSQERYVNVTVTEIAATDFWIPDKTTIVVGYETRLEPVFTPINASNQNITWSTDNTDVVSVSNDGLIRAHTITSAPAINPDGSPRYIEDTGNMVETVQRIKVNGKDAFKSETGTNGEIYKVKTTVTTPTSLYVVEPDGTTQHPVYTTDAGGRIPVYLCDDGSVVEKLYYLDNTVTKYLIAANETVLKPALVRAYDDFPVTITATSKANGKLVRKCLVSVTSRDTAREVRKVELKGLENWVFKSFGATQQLKAVFNDGNLDEDPYNREVTWESVDEDVAVVDKSGLMTPKNPGTTIITVRSVDGGKSDSKVMVVAPVYITDLTFGGLENDNNDYSYGKWIKMDMVNKSKRKVTATVVPSNASDKKLQWISSDNGIVTVDGAGNLTARGPGVAIVTVTPLVVENPGYGINSVNDSRVNALLSELRATTTSLGNGWTDPNGVLLSPTATMPLVVNYPLSEYKRQFIVVVEPKPPENMTWTQPMQTGTNLWAGEAVTVTVAQQPTDSTVNRVTFTPSGSAGATVTADTSMYSAIITPTLPNNMAEGSLNLECVMAIDNWTLPVTYWLNEHTSIDTSVKLADNSSIKSVQTAVVKKRPAESISINSNNVPATIYPTTSGVKTQFSLSAAVLPSNAYFNNVLNANRQSEIEWSTSNTNVAQVDNSGNVTINGKGTVTITAKLTGPENTGKSAVYTFTVDDLVNPTKITLPNTGDANEISVIAGTTLDVSAVLEFEAGKEDYSKTNVTWSLTGNSKLTLEKTGVSNTSNKITAAADATGEATLTVTADGGATASCKVKVTSAPAAETRIQANLFLTTGQTSAEALPDLVGAQTDTAIQAATFGSNDASIATVDSNGVITAKKSGFVKLTASYRGTTKEVVLEVRGTLPTKLKLRSSMRLELGKSSQLYADIVPYDATAFSWSSSDPTIATVGKNGEVTGLSLGRATITLTSADRKLSTRCVVIVSKPPDKKVTRVRTSVSKLTLNVGKYSTLKAIVSPSDASYAGVSWVSSNPNVARVDVGGAVYALSGGVAVITAITDDGHLKATCTVTVKVPVTSVVLSAKTATLKAGETRQLKATVLPADATTTVVKWESGNDKVATVSVDGRVTAVSAGTAKIYASVGGKKTYCTITVK